jgi:hypothetical protein
MYCPTRNTGCLTAWCWPRLHPLIAGGETLTATGFGVTLPFTPSGLGIPCSAKLTLHWLAWLAANPLRRSARTWSKRRPHANISNSGDTASPYQIAAIC